MRELSLHLLDVMENAVEAGATCIDMRIEEDLTADRLLLEVTDNGRGMSKEVAAKVTDPFFTTRTTRQVGLGLPLLAAAANRCEGELTIESEPNRGTTIRAFFRHSHLDRAPLGDLPAALLAILLSRREVDVSYTHRRDERQFSFDTAEIRRELDGLPLNEPLVREWMAKTLRAGEAELLEKRALEKEEKPWPS